MQVSARKKSNKKVIAKKPLTNLYEMNSNYSLISDADHGCHRNKKKRPVNKKIELLLNMRLHVLLYCF